MLCGQGGDHCQLADSGRNLEQGDWIVSPSWASSLSWVFSGLMMISWILVPVCTLLRMCVTCAPRACVRIGGISKENIFFTNPGFQKLRNFSKSHLKRFRFESFDDTISFSKQSWDKQILRGRQICTKSTRGFGFNNYNHFSNVPYESLVFGHCKTYLYISMSSFNRIQKRVLFEKNMKDSNGSLENRKRHPLISNPFLSNSALIQRIFCQFYPPLPIPNELVKHGFDLRKIYRSRLWCFLESQTKYAK